MSAMTRMQERLSAAQAGDEDATRDVAIYVFEKYRTRISRFFSADPAICREDLEMTFFEAIMQAIPHADGRGDDFYHIGQRGVWAVMSEVRVIRRLMDQRALLIPQQEEGEDPTSSMDTVPDDAPAFDGLVIERLFAQDMVRIVSNATLRPRVRQAVDTILSDEDLDPTEPGFNKALASKLGVSPQRTSQLMAEIRKEVGA